MKTLITILLSALASMAFAESVTLAWDANAASEHVTRYRLNYGPTPELGKSVTTDTAQVTIPDLAPGTWHFAVVAVNAAGIESPASEMIAYTITVPPPSAPKALRVVEIQTSANLREWKTVAMIPQDPGKPPAEFVRARITSVIPE